MLLLNRITDLSEQVVLAIGTFDGYHLGHQSVLAKAQEIAREQEVPFAVLTFREHPLFYLCPDSNPKQLMDLQQRRLFCLQYGVDELLEIDFNSDFANLSSEDFAKQVANHLVVVGENFSFGKDGQGSLNSFNSVEVCPLLKVMGEVVSSTRVRQEIGNGNLELVQKLLGRNYCIKGIVEHGDERGKFLGFPTANISLGEYCTPEYGAYVGMVKYADNSYPAMINVGVNPTFMQNIPRIEAHIIGFEGDLYDKVIQVDFIKKLRNEIKFFNINELKDQLEKDKNNTCAYFENVVL